MWGHVSPSVYRQQGEAPDPDFQGLPGHIVAVNPTCLLARPAAGPFLHLPERTLLG